MYPTAKTLDLFTSYQITNLSFEVNIVLGVLLGAFLSYCNIFILSSGYITAIILNKKGKLPMCFIFEWHDDKK